MFFWKLKEKQLIVKLCDPWGPSLGICEVIKQNESEVGSDMLLVSSYFYTSKYVPIQFETRH